MSTETMCLSCHEKTEHAEPIEIVKYAKNRYGLKTTCANCGKKKSAFIKKANVEKLPKDLKKKLNKLEKKETHSGGILPLLPLILAGIGAVSGVASTVTTAVQNQKKNEEQERHNRELENAARGSGLPSERSDSEDEEVATAFEVLKRKGYGIHSY